MRLKQYITEGKMTVKTKKDETGHTHDAAVNADGDGQTVGGDHVHKIFQWLVQPAEGHVHNLEE